MAIGRACHSVFAAESFPNRKQRLVRSDEQTPASDGRRSKLPCVEPVARENAWCPAGGEHDGLSVFVLPSVLMSGERGFPHKHRQTRHRIMSIRTTSYGFRVSVHAGRPCANYELTGRAGLPFSAWPKKRELTLSSIESAGPLMMWSGIRDGSAAIRGKAVARR